MQLHIFCPKEDKGKSKWFHAHFPRSGYKITDKCPHYLSGLNLARGGIYSKNYRFVNGKKVHGGAGIRVFEYVSIKFDFAPRYINGFSGQYNPKTNSWNGIMTKVMFNNYET